MGSTNGNAQVFEEPNAYMTEFERKQDALLRLLCHYLIYIGKVTALVENCSNEKNLLQTWRTQWNKPAAFTWTSTDGLEMHYRIEPPADYLISSSEDESLSSIDIDLSDFDNAALFTQDSDLLKCTACDTFWTDLDEAGVCQSCRNNTQAGEEYSSFSFLANEIDFLGIDVLSTSSQPAPNGNLSQNYATGNVSELFTSSKSFWEGDQVNIDLATTRGADGSSREFGRQDITWGRNLACVRYRPGDSILDRGKRIRSETTCWRCKPQKFDSGLGSFVCQRCLARPDQHSLSFPLTIPKLGSVPDHFEFSDLAADTSEQIRLGDDCQSSSDTPLQRVCGSISSVSAPMATLDVNSFGDAGNRRRICNSCRRRSADLNIHEHAHDLSGIGNCYKCHAVCWDLFCVGSCTNLDLLGSKWLI
jgi:hypothetical protein